MTERDGPAVLVDDFLVHAEFAQGLGGNGGEGCVDLYGRQVRRAGLDFFQGCGDGIGRLLVEQHVRPRYDGVVFVVYS